MGVKTSPDTFQRIMYELLGDIPNIQFYLDDILITSNVTFEEHADIMETVLERLQKSNFRANLKSGILVSQKMTIYDMKSLELLCNHNLRNWKRY
jgi:hypothetical protein